MAASNPPKGSVSSSSIKPVTRKAGRDVIAKSNVGFNVIDLLA